VPVGLFLSGSGCAFKNKRYNNRRPVFEAGRYPGGHGGILYAEYIYYPSRQTTTLKADRRDMSERKEVQHISLAL
jgi:hypothetical protein